MLLSLPAYAEQADKSDKTDETKAEESVEAEAGEKDKPTGPKHPVGGSVTLGHAFNHANFVESDADFGYQTISGTLCIVQPDKAEPRLSLGVQMIAPSFITPARHPVQGRLEKYLTLA